MDAERLRELVANVIEGGPRRYLGKAEVVDTNPTQDSHILKNGAEKKNGL